MGKITDSRFFNGGNYYSHHRKPKPRTLFIHPQVNSAESSSRVRHSYVHIPSPSRIRQARKSSRNTSFKIFLLALIAFATRQAHAVATPADYPLYSSDEWGDLWVGADSGHARSDCVWAMEEDGLVKECVLGIPLRVEEEMERRGVQPKSVIISTEGVHIHRLSDCVIRAPEVRDPIIGPRSWKKSPRSSQKVTYPAPLYSTLRFKTLHVECARIRIFDHLEVETLFLRAIGSVPMPFARVYDVYRFRRNEAFFVGDIEVSDNVQVRVKDAILLADGEIAHMQDSTLEASSSLSEKADGGISQMEGSRIANSGARSIVEIEAIYQKMREISDSLPPEEVWVSFPSEDQMRISFSSEPGGAEIVSSPLNPTFFPPELLALEQNIAAIKEEETSKAIQTQNNDKLALAQTLAKDFPDFNTLKIGLTLLSGGDQYLYAAHRISVASNIFFSRYGNMLLSHKTQISEWSSRKFKRKKMRYVTEYHRKVEVFPSTISGKSNYYLTPQGMTHGLACVTNGKTLLLADRAFFEGVHESVEERKKSFLSKSTLILSKVKPALFNDGVVFLLSGQLDLFSIRINGPYLVIRSGKLHWDSKTNSLFFEKKGLTGAVSLELPSGIGEVSYSPQGIQGVAHLPFENSVKALVDGQNHALARAASLHALAHQVQGLLQGKFITIQARLTYQKMQTRITWPANDPSVVGIADIEANEITLGGGVSLYASDLTLKSRQLKEKPAYHSTRAKAVGIGVAIDLLSGTPTASFYKSASSHTRSIYPLFFGERTIFQVESHQIESALPLVQKSRSISVASGGHVTYSLTNGGKKTHFVLDSSALFSDAHILLEKLSSPHSIPASPIKQAEYPPFEMTPIPSEVNECPIPPNALKDTSLKAPIVEGIQECFSSNMQFIKKLPNTILKVAKFLIAPNYKEVTHFLETTADGIVSGRYWDSATSLYREAKEILSTTPPEELTRMGIQYGSRFACELIVGSAVLKTGKVTLEAISNADHVLSARSLFKHATREQFIQAYSGGSAADKSIRSFYASRLFAQFDPKKPAPIWKGAEGPEQIYVHATSPKSALAIIENGDILPRHAKNGWGVFVSTQMESNYGEVAFIFRRSTIEQILPSVAFKRSSSNHFWTALSKPLPAHNALGITILNRVLESQKTAITQAAKKASIPLIAQNELIHMEKTLQQEIGIVVPKHFKTHQNLEDWERIHHARTLKKQDIHSLEGLSSSLTISKGSYSILQDELGKIFYIDLRLVADQDGAVYTLARNVQKIALEHGVNRVYLKTTFLNRKLEGVLQKRYAMTHIKELCQYVDLYGFQLRSTHFLAKTPQLPAPQSSLFERARFFHATSLEGLKGILRSKSINRSLRNDGFFVATVPDMQFGDVVLLFNERVAIENRILHTGDLKFRNGKEIGFSSPLPVNAETLEAIAVPSHIDREALASELATIAKRKIDIIPLERLFRGLDKPSVTD